VSITVTVLSPHFKNYTFVFSLSSLFMKSNIRKFVLENNLNKREEYSLTDFLCYHLQVNETLISYSVNTVPKLTSLPLLKIVIFIFSDNLN
jgi:hypothetical protein